MHPPSTEGNAPPQQASPQYKAPTSSGLQIPHMAQVNGRAPPVCQSPSSSSHSPKIKLNNIPSIQPQPRNETGPNIIDSSDLSITSKSSITSRTSNGLESCRTLVLSPLSRLQLPFQHFGTQSSQQESPLSLLSILSTGPRPLYRETDSSISPCISKSSVAQVERPSQEEIQTLRRDWKRRRLDRTRFLSSMDVIPTVKDSILQRQRKLRIDQGKQAAGLQLLATVPLPHDLTWKSITNEEDQLVFQSLKLENIVKSHLRNCRQRYSQPSPLSDPGPNSLQESVLECCSQVTALQPSQNWISRVNSISNRFSQYRKALHQLPPVHTHPIEYLSFDALFPLITSMISHWSLRYVQAHPQQNEQNSAETNWQFQRLPMSLYIPDSPRKRRIQNQLRSAMIESLEKTVSASILKVDDQKIHESKKNDEASYLNQNLIEDINDEFTHSNHIDVMPMDVTHTVGSDNSKIDFNRLTLVEDKNEVASMNDGIKSSYQTYMSISMSGDLGKDLWDDAIQKLPIDEDYLQQRSKQQSSILYGDSNEQHPTLSSPYPGILWGESIRTNDGRVALRRFSGMINLHPESVGLSSIQITFNEIDANTERVVRLQRSLKHSMSAFDIPNPIERLLAFGSLLLDQNDPGLFFTSPSAVKPPLIPARHIIAEDGLINERDDEEISSGSLSDVVDDGVETLFGAGSTTLTAVPCRRDGLKESKESNKKNEIKKRRQEKEQRIRLVLLGLAPQTTNLNKSENNESGIKNQKPNGNALVVASSLSNPISVYRELRRQFKALKPFDRLRISFDDETTLKDPYALPTKSRLEQWTQLELRHSSPAFHFTGIPARPFLVYVNRHHRPDFRWGIYEAHSSAQAAASSASSKTGGSRVGVFKLNLGQRSKSTVVQHRSSMDELWGKWVVRVPRMSDVLRRARHLDVDDPYSKPDHDDHNQSTSLHPADLITTISDLSLGDLSPIALFEHSEQNPPLLNHIGMVSRLTKFYRPPTDKFTVEQAKKKIKGRLGRFGQLKLVESQVPFFGSEMRLAKNQAVVVFQSRLYKAPVFPHPTNPHRAPSSLSELSSDWRYGIGRFHDWRSTDFLLVRKPITQIGFNGCESRFCSVFLRPIFMDSGPDLFDDENIDDDGNKAACGIFTVGQTQPLAEVPQPAGKLFQEMRRDWLRSYALRLARQGVTDFGTVKAKCQAKFKNIFEAGILQKHLTPLRDSSSLHTAVPGNQQYQGLMKIMDEEQIRQVCSPESICCLESSLIANSQLQQTGILLMKTPDRVSSAVQEIDQEEMLVRDKAASARRQLRQHELRYTNVIKLLASQLPAETIQRLESSFIPGSTVRIADLAMSITAVAGGTRRLGPIARLIEEMLLLTPWHLTKECLEVTTKQSGQFSLDGIGDPSGGRGEGLSLLRLQRRDGVGRPSSKASTALDQPREDLRKLSMKQLQIRLLKLGFDDQTVKLLPRWDQVALVRRFQNDDQSNDSTLLKSGKIPNDQYVKRLNEIFLNQRKALEPDNPIMTPSESDTATDHEDLLEKEVERDEDDRSHAGRSSILRPKVFESAVAPLGGRIMKEKSNQNERAKLEEELLSGLVIGSKGSSDNEENASAEDTNASERKQLEELRRSLGMTPQQLESITAKGLAQKFTPEELRLLRSKPMPRLRWSRKTRDPKTGELKGEKVVYIYGEENIELFYEWRKRRIAQKRFLESGGNVQQNQIGTASRSCRRCKQVGHISSNPICPKYTGARKSRGGAAAAALASRQAALAASMVLYGEDDGMETGSRVGTEISGISRGGVPHGGRNKRAALGTSPAEKSAKALKTSKTKDASSSATGKFIGALDQPTSPANLPAPKLPTRTTARQRHLLEIRGSVALGAVQSFQGSFEEALTEMNQIFQRVISKTDKEKRKWNLFRERVKDDDAPGYSAVVTNPMWLNRIVEKCKTREYTTSSSFLGDIQLIVDNCYKFNPSGHWIRPIVDSLNDFLRDELSKQGPWLTELDRFIQQYLAEQAEAAL